MPCHIIPDDLLRKIAENARTIEARNAARRSLAISEDLKAKRATHTVEPQEGESREVWDANNTEGQGTKVRGEDDPETGDETVDALYDDAGLWYSIVYGKFKRKSFDGAGAAMITIAHFAKDFDNAYWDGTDVWVGDGFYFKPFYLSPVVLYHEWTHALTQYTINLQYMRQSGALNESNSDFWAAAMEQFLLGIPAEQADWLIGRELFGDKVHGRALRDMATLEPAYNDPVIGVDPQVKHMRDYYTGSKDNYGVHTNSGISNRALALAAIRAGGMTTDTVLPVVAKVMFEKRVRPAATFQDFANALYTAAPDGAIKDAIAYGWDAVGIEVGASPSPQPEPPSESPCAMSDSEVLALARMPGIANLAPALAGVTAASDEEILAMFRNPLVVEAALAVAAMPQARRFMVVARKLTKEG